MCTSEGRRRSRKAHSAGCQGDIGDDGAINAVARAECKTPAGMLSQRLQELPRSRESWARGRRLCPQLLLLHPPVSAQGLCSLDPPGSRKVRLQGGWPAEVSLPGQGRAEGGSARCGGLGPAGQQPTVRAEVCFCGPQSHVWTIHGVSYCPGASFAHGREWKQAGSARGRRLGLMNNTVGAKKGLLSG